MRLSPGLPAASRAEQPDGNELTYKRITREREKQKHGVRQGKGYSWAFLLLIFDTKHTTTSIIFSGPPPFCFSLGYLGVGGVVRDEGKWKRLFTQNVHKALVHERSQKSHLFILYCCLVVVACRVQEPDRRRACVVTRGWVR